MDFKSCLLGGLGRMCCIIILGAKSETSIPESRLAHPSCYLDFSALPSALSVQASLPAWLLSILCKIDVLQTLKAPPQVGVTHAA